MKAQCYLFLLCLLVSILSCDSLGTEKIPIGYQEHPLYLLDNYEKVSSHIDDLSIDHTADNTEDMKSYFAIGKQVQIGALDLNPVTFVQFNRDQLIHFSTVYTIDETEQSVDFIALIEGLEAKELAPLGRDTEGNLQFTEGNSQTWVRDLSVDSTSSPYPKIRYLVKALP